jgi:drug/metabolite transporter (DMT)-like permease
MDPIAVVVLGVLITVAGGAVNFLGILCQKWDTNRAHLSPSSPLVAFMKRPWWILGILGQTIFVLPLYFIALTLVGITLVQPVSTSGLLVFIAGAVYLLKERLARREWYGIGFLVAGIVLVTASGVEGNVTMATFNAPGFLSGVGLFCAILGLISCAGIAIAKKGGARRIQGYAVLVGAMYSGISIGSQFATTPLDAAMAGGMDLEAWAYLGGGFAVLVLGTIGSIALAQKAFQQAQAIDLVPVSQALVNVLPVLAGIIIFKQTIVFLPTFLAGLALVIVAMALLARFVQ